MMMRRMFWVGLCLGALAGCGGTGGPTAADLTAPVKSTLSEMPPGPTRPAGTVAERVTQARERAAAKELPGAIALLEEGLAIDYKDRDCLALLARYFRERGKAVESAGTTEYYTSLVSSAEYYRRLRDTYPDATDEEKALGLDVFYDEATAHAKSLRLQETSGSLRDLVGAGFRDFDRVRQDPGWKGVLEIASFREEFDKLAAGAK